MKNHHIGITIVLVIALLLSFGVAPTFADSSSDVSISVKDFNAKGDGVTDDTLAFKNALKHLDSTGGGELVIPSTSAEYLLNRGNIDIPNNVTISGNRTKIIITANPSSNRIFKIIGKTNVKLEGIDFYSDSVMTSTCDIHIEDGATNVRISNCSATNHRYFVKVDSNKPRVLFSQNIYIDNINTYGTVNPFYLASVNNIFIDNCRLDRSSTIDSLSHHYYIDSGSQNINITNQTLIGGKGYSIDVKNDCHTPDLAPQKINFDNITFLGPGGAIVSEYYADITVSNIKGNIDTALTSDQSMWFASLNNGNIYVDTINITGGTHLTSGFTSPEGKITVNNGIVRQLTGNIHNNGLNNNLALLRVTNVEFLDGNSTNGEFFWNSGTPITLVEFKNCKFNIKTQPTNDIFRDRAGETDYYNCIFDIDTTSPISFVHSTKEPAIASFHNCIFKGNFMRVEYVISTGAIEYFDCVNQKDNSIFNSPKEIKYFYGSGSPEGIITAPISSVYYRIDGGAGTSMYIKETGTGNTGWVAK